MTNPILVTGAAGRVGAIGRTVTELLLKQGKPVRAMVRNEDERAQALRDMGAEVVIGDLLDLDSMHRVIAGCETMYFGMSVSDTYLAATVNTAAVAGLVLRGTDSAVRGAADAFAAGAILALVSETMIPEAFHGSPQFNGLLLVIGFVVLLILLVLSH